jgi:tryptophanyl-tRNA synthetase
MEQYGEFKSIVASEMSAFLVDFQSRLAQLDEARVLAKLQKSERAMNELANETLHRVQVAVGLRKDGI